jgi:hypothetical protein
MGAFARTLAILTMLTYLAFAAVAADRFLSGPTTAPYGRQIFYGTCALVGLFFLGMLFAGKRRTFLGFGRFQWAIFPTGAACAGAAARYFIL